jgi:dipeptidyl aminopeptidase/acylaminoacyl peptidase
MSFSVHGWRSVPPEWLWMTMAAVLLLGCAATPPPPAVDSEVRQVGALSLRDVPEVPPQVLERLRQYQNTRSARVVGWVGDSVLITTRFGDTVQLHRVDAPMGARRQITFFDEPVAGAYTSPRNDDGFIFARDTGGSEFYQLYWFDWAGGEQRRLTDGVSRYGGVRWANGGDRFAYYTTERNGRSRDIHVQNLYGAVSVALEEDEGAWFPEDFSPDDTRLLVSRYVSINESYLYEVDLATGARRALLEDGLKVAIGQARYDAGGRGVYFTSDLGAEFMRLHHLDLDTGQIEVLTSEVPWNVEAFTLSDDRSRLALSVNEGGISRIHVWRLPDRRPLALPEMPAGVLSGLAFSADGTRLAVSLSTPRSPTDVWSVSLTDRKLTRWTMSEVGGLDTEDFVAPELVTYPTFDVDGGGPRRIPAFVYRPRGPGPHPVLVSIHGGPESQYRPYFSSTIQYLVGELGMAVIAPNVRGSAGYGKSYLKLDDGAKREDSVRDIGTLIDWISEQPDLDPGRVVVMGGSYGGYMVLASLVHYPDRLAAGIESVGISNFVTFLENTQPYRQDLRRAEYGDERDPGMRAKLEAISPLNHVDAIQRPLMISAGNNDPRVPASESEQIYAALKRAGTPVWYVLAENEGHGFRKKVNRDYNAGVMTLFLESFVLH